MPQNQSRWSDLSDSKQIGSSKVNISLDQYSTNWDNGYITSKSLKGIREPLYIHVVPRRPKSYESQDI